MKALMRGRGRTAASYAAWVTALCMVAGLVAFTGSAMQCAGTAAAVSVALKVTDEAGVQRRAEPVTSGVPLARSLDLKSTAGLRLLDAAGREVPAQFQVTSRWGGAPGDDSRPIRWVLVDFQAHVEPGGTAAYYLKDGGSGDAAGTGLAVTRDDPDILEVSTGAARFAFARSSFRLFEHVFIGDRRVVAPGSASGIVAVDTSGRTYRSADAEPSRVVLETDGPLRKTVRVRGDLAGPGGSLLEYTARISLFAGSPEARVALTVNNRREPVVVEGQPQLLDIGSPNSAGFRDMTVKLECEPGAGAGLAMGEVEGGPMEAGSLKVYQDSSGTSSWDRHRGNHPRPQSYVSFRGYRTYRDGAQVSSGNHASPWLDCSGGGGGVAVAVRDFWQNFPKALRGSGATVEAALFPDEYAGDYSFRPLEQKTHELMYRFHGPGEDREALSALSKAFQSPLFAAATPAHYASSGAFGRIAVPTGDSFFEAYEQLNRATLDGRGANLHTVIRDADFYSWQEYGDVPVDYENGGTGSFNLKYNFDLGMLTQFARTGDPRWLKLAQAGGRHVADIDVLHHQGKVDQWWEGGYIGHGYHDEDGNLNPHRNGGGPHPDLVFGAPGLFTLYHMTGYRPGYDAAVEISNNIKYRFDNTFGRGNDEGYANAYDYENDCESPRPFAHGLWVLIEAYRATGQESYMETAEWLISNAHAAVDQFLTSPVAGDRRYTKLFCWDLLQLSLGRYLDLCGEADRPDRAGARDLLLAMARQEADVMWKKDAAGNQGVPYAWMRDGTPWGWEDQEVAVNICNWQLLTADALSYAVIYGADPGILEKAREAFRTGSSPTMEGYSPVYTATTYAVNRATCGLVYMALAPPPDEEKAAGERFHQYICLENPGAKSAGVRLDYFLDGGGARSQTVQVPGGSRRTVSVNQAAGGGRDVSATVSSDRPVVAERAMYFNYNGSVEGGHCAVGAVQPEEAWYFAEGCTRPGVEQWLTVLNPGKEASRVTLTYMPEEGQPTRQRIDAPAASRTTVNVNAFLGPGQDVSTMVEASLPVVVERPMYFTCDQGIRGGHNALGAGAPSRTWHFAEGTTRSNPVNGRYQEWLCLQNPGDRPARATVFYMFDSGGEVAKEYTIEPSSRLTVDVNLAVGADRDVSARVDSDVPLVVERPMYFSLPGGIDGGHNVVGAAAPSDEWHFAEGCTREGFQTWLCLANPQRREVRATTDYFLAGGQTVSRELILPPRSRSTVDVKSEIGPGRDVSVRVTADAPVVAERPVYFSYGAGWAGGHVAMGTPAPGTEWHFAEGCTR